MSKKDVAVLWTSGTIIFMSLLGVLTRLIGYDLRILFLFQVALSIIAAGVNWYMYFTDDEDVTPFTWMHRSKYMILYYIAGVVFMFQLGYLFSR